MAVKSLFKGSEETMRAALEIIHRFGYARLWNEIVCRTDHCRKVSSFVPLGNVLYQWRSAAKLQKLEFVERVDPVQGYTAMI